MALADELGAGDATRESIGRHPGDVGWLKRAIATAEARLRDQQPEQSAFPIPETARTTG
jgi:hypothetical protein